MATITGLHRNAVGGLSLVLDNGELLTGLIWLEPSESPENVLDHIKRSVRVAEVATIDCRFAVSGDFKFIDEYQPGPRVPDLEHVSTDQLEQELARRKVEG